MAQKPVNKVNQPQCVVERSGREPWQISPRRTKLIQEQIATSSEAPRIPGVGMGMAYAQQLRRRTAA